MKKVPPPTFSQLFREHLRERGSLLAADAVLMLLAFFAPSVVLLGIKVLSWLGTSGRWLEYSETADGILLFLAILVIGIDGFLKLVALTLTGWQQWKTTKPKTSS